VYSRIRRLLDREDGITALETAIILIAFVVVAAVFAFTILSAGTFTTERSKEAIYEGLSEVRGTIELRGSIIGYGDYVSGVSGTRVLTEVVFSLSNVAGGEPVDLTAGSSGDNVVIIEYRDSTQRAVVTDWTTTWLAHSDGASADNVLEERELVEVMVPISGTTGIASAPGINTTFVIEVKPPQGAVIALQRTTPSVIDNIMDLN